MTAKQILLEFVAGLSEEEALVKLPLLADAGPPPALTAAQMAEIRTAIESLDEGKRIPHAEVKRRFNLA